MATAPPRVGRLRRSTTASVVALALATGAFTVALIAATDSQRLSRALATRLLPAASASNQLGSLFTEQQTWLRQAVTSGDVGPVEPFDDLTVDFLHSGDRIASLARADQPVTARLATLLRAYRTWLNEVSGPQITAMSIGDFASAQAQQADLQRVNPLTSSVRSAGLALQSEITGEQRRVADRLNRVHDALLGALIALIAVVATICVAIIVAVRRGLLRPFRMLNKAVAAVADGSYGTVIPAVGEGELTVLSRDIELMRTRLVAAIDERERAQQGLRDLFDLAPDAMVAVAADGLIVRANARAAALYGYRADELIGAPVKTLLPPEWRASVDAVSTSVLSPRWQGALADREIKSAGLRRDGSTFPSEVRLSRMRTAQGTLIVAAVRDGTERLAMEAERERLRVAGEQELLQRRLRESRRLESLGQLIGGVARDFDNLLGVIAGHNDLTAGQLAVLAVDDDRLEPVLADVDKVAAAARQALTVTRQLLTFSRGDAVCLDLVDLNAVVDRAAPLLRRSLGEHIDLIIGAEPALWPVEADHGQLEQVLLNVTLNARDAMPEGGRFAIETGNAEVDATYAAQRPGLEPGRYARLALSDTGTGIDAAAIERVFEPFFSTKPRGRGTGLGLATVYGIVTGLGGTVDIYSAKGLGTTVSVLLPVTERVTVAAAEPGRPGPDRRGQGEVILLVADEDSLRALTSAVLVSAGYQVREATDGADAVRQAADPAHRIELLVTDMVLPGLLGIEVVARVRAARPWLPALFLSGYARPVLDFHGILAPDRDIVPRPFTEAALLSRVRNALRRSAAGDGT